ncbi:MAG: hypothetical protein ACOX2O_01950 [Bdellovibrionota bacterium]
MKKIKILNIIAILALFSVIGCSSRQEIVSGPIVKEQVTVVPDPGAVEFVYEPPMVDVIDIPPGYDPEGTYYRPAHQAVVEVRQGRWRYYKDPNNK